MTDKKVYSKFINEFISFLSLTDYSQQKSSSSPSESPCVYEAQSVAPTKTPSRINAVKKSPNGNRGAIRKIMKNESKWSENLRASANKVASDVIEEIHENKQKKNGKWDAVMNKIAENKRSKKSFHEVRSKVTCGQQDWPSSKRDSSSSASTSKR